MQNFCAGNWREGFLSIAFSSMELTASGAVIPQRNLRKNLPAASAVLSYSRICRLPESASRRLNLRACCSAAGVFLYSANGKATLSGYSRLAVPPAGRTVEARQLRDGYPGELITRKYIVAVTLPAWLLSRVPSAGLRLPRYGCGCGDCRSRGIPIQIHPEGSCPSLCI